MQNIKVADILIKPLHPQSGLISRGCLERVARMAAVGACGGGSPGGNLKLVREKAIEWR